MASDTFLRAVEAAQDRFPGDRWFALMPKERTGAIYDELHRLDAEALANAVQDAVERIPDTERSSELW
jgi:hypothetical protein